MWCQEAMMARLRARPLVRGVHVSTSTGCLVVEHDHDSPAALMAEVRDNLHGWELAGNGERVMVYLDVHEQEQCPVIRGVEIQDERGKHGAPSFQRGDVWPPHCAAMSESLSRSDPVGRLGSAAESEHSP
jgi:hypothetical protein